MDDEGTLWYKDRICVPKEGDFRQMIIDEAHNSAYSIHPGSTKMYLDLKQKYWWNGMKSELPSSWPIATHVKGSKLSIRSQQNYYNTYPSQFGNGMR